MSTKFLSQVGKELAIMIAVIVVAAIVLVEAQALLSGMEPAAGIS